MQYLIAVGHDVVLGSLLPLDPQPRTVGYLHGRRSYAASGAIIDELDHVEYLYSAIESAAQYQSILGQFGLATANTALVTVTVQDERYAEVQRNGRAVLPLVGSEGGRENYFLRDFTVLVKDVRALA